MQTGEAPATDIFVARQPIFDERQRVFAYELLFRSGIDDYLTPGIDPDQRTSQVISNGTIVGFANLTDSKPAFVNFPQTALLAEFALALSPGEVVIELLESIEPSSEVVAACKRLKAAGYRLALDDFVDRPEYAPLVQLADYIKVDVLQTPPPERLRLARLYGSTTRRLIAEKVETREVLDEAVAEGYGCFQGYFFSRPTIVRSRALTGYRLNYLRLIQELHSPDTDLRRIEELVKQEASIALRLLRRVNSAAYGFRVTTSALRHALVLLGKHEVCVCATVWSLAELGRDLPSEVIISSTLRARLCELLA